MNEERTHRRWVTPALVIAVIALAATVWQWLDTREHLAKTDTELARRLAELTGLARESTTAGRESRDIAREAHDRVGTLETRLAEYQNQQLALAHFYQELARDRDDWVLAEIDQILVLADQQLRLAGNVRAALAGLDAVQARLERMEKARFLAIRDAVARDMARLRGTRNADAAATGARLESLSAAVERMRLVTDPAPAQTEKTSGPRDTLGGFWDELKDLIRIQRLPRADLPLVAPDQAWFLRQNLRLRLLSARIAALSGEGSTYASDIKTAQAWVERYFNPRDPATRDVSAALRELAGVPVGQPLPGLAESLAAVHSSTPSR